MSEDETKGSSLPPVPPAPGNRANSQLMSEPTCFALHVQKPVGLLFLGVRCNGSPRRWDAMRLLRGVMRETQVIELGATLTAYPPRIQGLPERRSVIPSRQRRC